VGARKVLLKRRTEHQSRVSLELTAENMKERIYATITLIAVIITLWQTSDHHTAKGAIASILGTSTALWLATLVSARVSHHVVKGKSMTAGELRKLFFASSGLFAPAFLPVLLIVLSRNGWMSLETALLVSIITLLLSLFALSFMAARRIYKSPLQLIFISSLELLVGIGVVLLKLAVGE
jgi:hypothetical protein